MNSDTTSLVTDAGRTLKDYAPQIQKMTEYLPWRDNRTPYRVFVAEFLLIRTRTDLVARVFEAFVEKYPDVFTLAEADVQTLTRDLGSLGLTKRALMLRKASVYIRDNHGGDVPNSVPSLLKVPGLGNYTATAIAANAFGEAGVPADSNIFRFLARLTTISVGHPTKGSSALKQLLPLLSANIGGPTVETLIDFARLVCRPRKPKCALCPLISGCRYYNRETHL